MHSFKFFFQMLLPQEILLGLLAQVLLYYWITRFWSFIDVVIFLHGHGIGNRVFKGLSKGVFKGYQILMSID